MTTNNILMSDVKEIINYTIDNNLKLEEKGITPIAVGFEASAGIGKTSIIEEVAKERGMTLAKISLHTLDETGDLIGYPQIEYECQIAKKVKDKDGNIKFQILPNTTWLNTKQLDNKDANTAIKQTGKTRMGYAKPAWVPEYNENGCLVLLDDYVRATPQLLQASMDLILTQKYISWSLPKKTSIFLTNNQDNGEYNVNSLDEAQRSRFLNFSIEWSKEAWSEWAEKAGLDNRCINFALSYSDELFNADEEGNRICNPRTFTLFANMISGVKDWDDINSLAFISLIAKGCFKDDRNRFASMFTAFLKNKMHLLLSPKDMLKKDWKDIKGTLKQSVYDENGQYRADIASLLEKRFCSFVNIWLDSDNSTPISKVKDRILDFIDSPDMLFTKDLFYHMIKTITAKHKSQTNKLLFEPKIAAMIS